MSFYRTTCENIYFQMSFYGATCEHGKIFAKPGIHCIDTMHITHRYIAFRGGREVPAPWWSAPIRFELVMAIVIRRLNCMCTLHARCWDRSHLGPFAFVWIPQLSAPAGRGRGKEEWCALASPQGPLRPSLVAGTLAWIRYRRP